MFKLQTHAEQGYSRLLIKVVRARQVFHSRGDADLALPLPFDLPN